jgi:hypothetical protein
MEDTMSAKQRSRPSHATVVAYLALFVALGGSAYAAVGLPRNSVGTKQLKDGAVTSAKFKRSATAPNATHAINADHAVNADHSANADQATNAGALGGSPPSDYRVNCPSAMGRAGSLCYDQTERPAKTFASALQTCARSGLRLPDAGELALVFDHSDATQDRQWISAFSVVSGVGLVAGVVSQDTTRTLSLTTTPVADNVAFRCVGGVTN